MAGLKQIKIKIRSIEKTETVTKAMEAVSAAKMRRAQQTALAARAYARAAVSVLARVSGSKALANHPLTRSGELLSSVAGRQGNSPESNSPSLKGLLYIVITSDKGLAGALNSAVLRRAQDDITKSGVAKESISIIAVGKKANDFFIARGFRVEAFHLNNDELTSELVADIVNEAAQRFTLGAVDAVRVIYQQFVSTFEQRPTTRTIFPLSLTELQSVVADMARKGHVEALEHSRDVYTVEPSEEEVLSSILPKLAGVFVYHALLESQASEHSARMVAMKSASDKAVEMEHALTITFNKARQAAITREVSEIIGGMEAMTA